MVNENRSPNTTMRAPIPRSQVKVGGINTPPEDPMPNESNLELLTYMGRIRGHHAKILVDGGSMGNFIAEKLVKKAAIPVQIVEGFSILFLNGATSICNKEILETYLEVQDHHEKIRLKVAPLPHHDIILGKPWLEMWNPQI